MPKKILQEISGSRLYQENSRDNGLREGKAGIEPWCTLAGWFLSSVVDQSPGGGGGRWVLPKKISEGVQPDSQNACLI